MEGKFEIALNQRAQWQMRSLSDRARAILLTAFNEMMHLGLSELPLGRVSRIEGTSFSLSLTYNRDKAIREGVIVNGFFLDKIHDTYYIMGIYEVDDGKRGATNEKHIYQYLHKRYEDEGNLDEFDLLEADWSARREPSNEKTMAATPVSEILQCFYPSPQYIEGLYHHAENYGCDLPMGGSEDFYYAYRKFDAASKRLKQKPLLDHIDSVKERRDAITFCNFVDETNPLSFAQSNFSRFLAVLISRYFKDFNVEIVDIVFQDKRGLTPYLAEYGKLFSQNLLGKNYSGRKTVPFTAVFGQISKDTGDQLSLPLLDEMRLFDYHLFDQCEDDWTARDRMQFNAARVMNKVLQHAANMNWRCRILPFDLRDKTDEEVAKAVVELSRTAVVVLVDGSFESEVLNAATRAAANAVFQGFPHVVVLQANIVSEERPISVYCREEACYFSYRYPQGGNSKALVSELCQDIIEYHEGLGADAYGLGSFL